MIITILSKDVGEVREVYRKSVGFKWQLEDGIEEWIKLDLGLEKL
ncbi:hypothetical protein LCGC14_0439490 [marine sediment metagenome]|uniref:Uncharacterized protein n=1 Tax=marine sediment metagenome TaxID=412755 RepID=A0A0F9V7W8_9ZZZZ